VLLLLLLPVAVCVWALPADPGTIHASWHKPLGKMAGTRWNAVAAAGWWEKTSVWAGWLLYVFVHVRGCSTSIENSCTACRNAVGMCAGTSLISGV
jgi:hypothetical protein